MTTSAQLQAAVDQLRQPLQETCKRGIFNDLSGIMLSDESGAEPIECTDDVTAVHFFIAWLEARRKDRVRDAEVKRRRSALALVELKVQPETAGAK
jgi:hypothetical protein